MKYILLIYSDEKAWTEPEWEHCVQESTKVTHDLHAKKQFIAASPLHPIASATSIRIRENKRLITDGPFAETREQLGGFFLIDVNNLDEAIDVASRLPSARKGTVEIRPVVEVKNLPVVK